MNREEGGRRRESPSTHSLLLQTSIPFDITASVLGQPQSYPIWSPPPPPDLGISFSLEYKNSEKARIVVEKLTGIKVGKEERGGRSPGGRRESGRGKSKEEGGTSRRRRERDRRAKRGRRKEGPVR
jgi:hypothetical protein